MATVPLERELEGLTHAGRIRRMIAIGAAVRAGDRDARAQVDALYEQGVFGRWMVLQTVHGSGDGERAVSAAADASRWVRRSAFPILARYASDAQIVSVLKQLVRTERKRLLEHLGRQRRQLAIDEYVSFVANLADPALAEVLTAASDELVRMHHGQVAARGGWTYWRRLARRHPRIAARVLAERCQPDVESDRVLLHDANAVLPILATRSPDVALELISALKPHFAIQRLGGLTLLGRQRPNAVAMLAFESEAEGVFQLARVAHRLDDAVLERAIRERPADLQSNRGPAWSRSAEPWFERLSSARRAWVHSLGTRVLHDEAGHLPPAVLALLPAEVRLVETRRHLASPLLATEPSALMRYASLLPYDEARAQLDVWIRHPEGELRAEAIYQLGKSVAFDRSRIADYLALVVARKNEQDPVRCRMFAALAELPLSCFRPETLDSVGTAIRHALDAADLSHGTAAFAQTLVVRLLPRYPGWAGTWLETLARERGYLAVDGLESRLSDADAAALGPALGPLLEAWRVREREPQILALAGSLGRRLPQVAPLVEILAQVARNSVVTHHSAQAVSLLVRHVPETAARLIPELLQRDATWSSQPVVYSFLHRHRQDLLTPYLGRKVYQGRFSTGRTWVVLGIDSGFQRWTPSQQRLFASSLGHLTTGDPVRDTPTLIWTIQRLRRMPAISPDALIRLASDSREAVRTTAVRALGKLDTDGGLPTLIEALGDERARVAIQAVRGLLREMPSERALAILSNVPMTQVTVAKEVVRLVGEIPGEASFQTLQAWSGRTLHRDVRVALLRALWDHLDRPEAWVEIETAAGSGDAAALSVVVRTPVDRLDATGRARLARVLTRVLETGDPKARLEVLARMTTQPVGDAEGLLLEAALACLGRPGPQERTSAGAAVVASVREPDVSRTQAAVARLLPDRRGIRALLDALTASFDADPLRLTPLTRALLDVLEVDPLTSQARLGLVVLLERGDRLAEQLALMFARNAISADGVVFLEGLLAIQARQARGASLDAFEMAAAGHGDERMRRLALAVLVGRASAYGWTSARLERLRAYRRDPSPLVAEAAQFTLPDAEVESV
ncbi:MAG: HEAT repeat domain-containing protein [Isosphaeraceae bacterium]